MGNFLRRFLAFILGMVFGIVALGSTVVIAGYYAYKNLKLSTIVPEESIDLGDFGNSTIEDLVALMTTATASPETYTFDKLEADYGLKITDVLKSFGLNVDAMHPDDVKAFGKISPFMSFDKIADTIGLGVVFGLIPKNDDGKYPVFSEGARSKLRSYTLGEVMEEDSSTGKMKLLTVVSSLKVGGVLSASYDENYNNATAEYTYSIEGGGVIETLGNLSVEVIVNLATGETFNLPYEICEGSLSDLGETTIYELIGMSESDGNQLVSSFGNKQIKDLFKFENEEYVFDIMLLLNDIKVGSLMGMTECSESGCTVGHDSHVYGWYDANGELVDNVDIAGELMNSLYDITIEELTNGTFDITTLTDSIYLGKALGYKIGSKTGYCSETCTEKHHSTDCVENCSKNHSHTYYWVDSDNNYVGALYNGLSNIALNDVMNGELSIDNVLGGLKVGELMGYTYCDGTSCELTHTTHAKGWYDASGNLVTGENIGEEITVKLYDTSISDLMNGEFDLAELTDGIYLGKALGYSVGSKTGYCSETCTEKHHSTECDVNCSINHSHTYYWVDSDNNYVGKMNNAISNIALSDVMNGKLNIEDVLGELKIGELMGNTYCDGVSCEFTHTHVHGWYNASGTIIDYDNLESTDKILYNLYSTTFKDILDGNFNVESALKGLYVGELMGYTYCDGTNCVIGHTSHEIGWYKDGVRVSGVENTFGDIKLEDMLDGSVDFKSKISDLTLQDVINVEGSTVFKSLKDVKIGDLSTKVDELKIGEIMGYTYCDGTSCELSHAHAIGWYDASGNPVSGIYKTLSGYSISDIAKGKLENLKLGDLIETDGNAVLSLLANSSLSGISDDANKLKLGEIMGYTYCDGTSCKLSHAHAIGWYDASGNPVSGINGKIADYTIKDVSDGKLGGDDFVNSLVVGDVIKNTNTGAFSLIYKGELTVGGTTYTDVADVPVSELNERMAKGVQNAKYNQLKGAGIELLEEDEESKITTFYDSRSDDSLKDGKWKDEKTLSGVISDIINSISTTTTSS